MLYREIMAVCSEIHTKHINTVCRQNVEFVHVNHALEGKERLIVNFHIHLCSISPQAKETDAVLNTGGGGKLVLNEEGAGHKA
jgi:hypothetical protein